jgi:hypothetical protein
LVTTHDADGGELVVLGPRGEQPAHRRGGGVVEYHAVKADREVCLGSAAQHQNRQRVAHHLSGHIVGQRIQHLDCQRRVDVDEFGPRAVMREEAHPVAAAEFLHV